MNPELEHWILITVGAIVVVGLVAAIVMSVAERRLAQRYPRPKPEPGKPDEKKCPHCGARLDDDPSGEAIAAANAGAVAAAAAVTSISTAIR